MTPAEQIHLETITLEKQITDLIQNFEKRTGTFLESIGLAQFCMGNRRSYSQPVNVWVATQLPPLPQESKQV